MQTLVHVGFCVTIFAVFDDEVIGLVFLQECFEFVFDDEETLG